jgi:gas vesicle protein
MSLKPIIKGVSVGAAVGAVLFVISRSSPSQRRVLKKDANRAYKAMGNVWSDFSDMI